MENDVSLARFARRSFLAGASSLALLPWLRSASVSHAAPLPSKRRFVVFFTPNEPIEEAYWKPQGATGNEFSLAGATLPAPIDELASIRDNLLMIGNVRMSNPGYDHAAIGILLTGVPNEYPSGDTDQNAAIGGGISLDQLLGERLDEEPLVLGTRTGNQNGTSRLS
jgi:hypothetical protein